MLQDVGRDNEVEEVADEITEGDVFDTCLNDMVILRTGSGHGLSGQVDANQRPTTCTSKSIAPCACPTSDVEDSIGDAVERIQEGLIDR